MMWIVFSALLLFFTITTSFFSTLTASTSPALHPDELTALGEIATTLGIKRLNLSAGDPCRLETLTIIQQVGFVSNPEGNNTIGCDCTFNNNMTCHVTVLILGNFTLLGKLPPELAKLRYLQSIGLEANQFSGPIPDELGNLTSLRRLHLASNQFNGSLPTTLARLVNLEEFWIGDNNFNGTIPAYIGNWPRLKELFIYASGLKGPIPVEVTRLENLTDVRISDTTGINSFPILSSEFIETLILRNVGLSGPIPPYIWNKTELKRLDLSFNKLTGEVQEVQNAPKHTYLTGNMLSGDVESAVSLNRKSDIDLSYNHFSWSSSCQAKRTGLLPCAGPTKCMNYQRFLHINCGGGNVTITNSRGKITYQADDEGKTMSATNKQLENWGISNTGDFTDDPSDDDSYIITTSLRLSRDSSDIYKTARRSALSSTYYAFCLENGTYNVKLHFMEIQFSNQELYSRLGRRIFDVYVQGKLFLRDFNIKEEANGTLKPVIKTLNTNVTDHILEIRLYWAGKGTTLIPNRGYYGPLISAISLCHSKSGTTMRRFLDKETTLLKMSFGRLADIYIYTFSVSFSAEKIKHHTNYPLILGTMGALLAITLLVLGLFARRRCRRDKNTRERDLRAEGLQTTFFSWRQLQAATNNFDEANKLGEGGKSSLKLDWGARQKICVGIARGLEFLHEGSAIRMVHRDIKTTNVLLDADLNAKISDFGLARLHEEDHTHISTKIAGTIGYMAPEYVLWGQLTEKADVYSFGVVAMEIVSGKSNSKKKGSVDDASLINWALTLQQKGATLEIVDPVLEGDFNSKEAVRMINVALVCTNSSPSLRPTMSEAVQMLEGVIEITQVMSDPGLYGDNWSISKLRDVDTHGSSSTSGVTDQTTTTIKSSVSGSSLYP
ncbi:unnamed protein product [Thlaspi arvense]|uniref:non-specific serine/threonine protein kinase n=1 Tax=Thlaspi arvense TaxID=13288 RepID=A0AAU9R664_THLAR|nr:unnamed protein product [Thlaspi arvense]